MVSWSNPDVRPCQGIDLFILYVLFPNSYHSMFSGEFTFCLFIDYAYRCTWIRVHKTTFERNSSLGYNLVVWNGKQNIQAKKVFSSCISQNPTIRKYSNYMYTAISRKVVGKSARDNPERYCGWFWKLCSSKKNEKMAQEATNICLRVLKESNKSMFDSYSHQEQCIDHIPHYLSGSSRAHFFRQPFSK